MAGDDPATIIPTDPDTIVLDLQPDESEFGRLCGEVGLEYVAKARFKSPFQYYIKRAIEVHGYGTFDEQTMPASLLVFDLVLWIDKSSRDRRVKSVKIGMEFKKSSDNPDVEDPRIVELAPGRPTIYLAYSTEENTDTSVINISTGVNKFGANAVAGWRAEHKKRKDRVFYATIDGLARPSNDESERANYATWLLKENTSQKSAVPTDVSLAVLLAHGEGDFICKTEVRLEVDGVSALFGGFHLWNQRPQVSLFRANKPLVRFNRNPQPTAVEANHLEKLLMEEKKLGRLVTINMPDITSHARNPTLPN